MRFEVYPKAGAACKKGSALPAELLAAHLAQDVLELRYRRRPFPRCTALARGAARAFRTTGRGFGGGGT
jgi:hypothetical protein